MDLELSEYIYKKLLNEAKHYRWKIVLDSHKKAVEIYFVVHIDVEENQHVQDINATVNDSGKLYFEEVVCFYDETSTNIVPINYLKAIPLDPVIGIEKGFVDAFLKHLNILASDAISGLRLFLNDETRTEFSLTWDTQNMENTITTMKNTNHYSIDHIPFQTQEDESIIEKFKEDQNGGVERI